MTDSASNNRIKIYGQIISVLIESLLGGSRRSYIHKSMVDLIAICLKALFEDNSYFSFLQKMINMFLPSYSFIENFNTTTETSLQFIQPRYSLDFGNLQNYCTLLETLVSMFDYITVHAATKTYYEYRRSIYVFRNSYLAYFLYFGVEYCKILFDNFNNSEGMSAVMRMTVQLLELVFMYPFTLSLHEFEVE